MSPLSKDETGRGCSPVQFLRCCDHRHACWSTLFYPSSFDLLWFSVQRCDISGTLVVPLVVFVVNVTSKQARSQDLEKGGAFLKEWEKCKRPWPEFSLFLNQNHTVCPNIEREFLGNLGNSNVFSAQKRVVYKNKKDLHRNWDWFFGQNRKFKRFFPPKNRWSKKKKKKNLHRNWDWFFDQNRKFKRHVQYFTISAPNFLWGGAVFNFSPKIGLKSTKNVRFCILHKPMEGLEGGPPAPPGYATASKTRKDHHSDKYFLTISSTTSIRILEASE